MRTIQQYSAAEAGTELTPANFEDPAIFPDLVDSGLLNLDGALKLGQVLNGSKLTKTVDSLTPITPAPIQQQIKRPLAARSLGILLPLAFVAPRCFWQGLRRDLVQPRCSPGRSSRLPLVCPGPLPSPYRSPCISVPTGSA